MVLLLIVGAGVLAAYLVLTGISSETSGISKHLSAGADEIEGWLKDLGSATARRRRRTKTSAPAPATRSMR